MISNRSPGNTGNTSSGRTSDRHLPAGVGYVTTIAIEIVLTVAILFLQRFLPIGYHPAMYILVVAIAAYFFGEGPAIFAAVLGLLIFDYFFVPPLRTIIPFAQTRLGWATVIVFLVGSSVIGLITISMRRSEQRIGEIADDLRESQKDLNRAQAVAHTGSWRMDVRHNELLWSDEVYRMFGVPEGTPLTYESFLAAIHPEDREYVDRKWTAALRGESYDIVHRIIVDDTVKWVRERAELEFDEQGRLSGGFGTVQDITEIKTAEERIRQINQDLAMRNAELDAERERWRGVVEGIADEVWIADTEGKMSLINLPEVTRMGLKEFKDKSVYEVLEEVDILYTDGRPRPPEEAPLLRSLKGEIVRGEEIMRSRRTGRIRYRQFSSAPTQDVSGKITGAVAVVRDVTEQKETEQALRAEQEHKLEFYRATIMAATNGKLRIVERDEIEKLAGPPMVIWEISNPEEIITVRHGVEDVARTAGMDDMRIGEFLVCVGEAGTNAVKHAGHGTASIHRRDDTLIFVISDQGPGIPVLALPEVALRQGYSTAGTLGMGYKMMIQFADRIYLATSPEGTSVGIEMRLHPEERPIEVGLMERYEL